MKYKAFISYSHAADGKLAPALQRALERFGRAWYQKAAIRIFRDETNVALNPGLWTSIEATLADAEYFLNRLGSTGRSGRADARIAGSLTEMEPTLMPSLPLAKCPKAGAPSCPPVSSDIAHGPYHQSTRH